MEKTKFKLTHKWWFWLLLAFVVVSIIGSFAPQDLYQEDYEECKREYRILEKEYNQLEEEFTALDIAATEFIYAMDNYCIYDPMNPICISWQEE